jgi:hypothetical protein
MGDDGRMRLVIDADNKASTQAFPQTNSQLDRTAAQAAPRVLCRVLSALWPASGVPPSHRQQGGRRAQALDVPQLFAFLRVTQPAAFTKLAITDDTKHINRLKFLARLSSEIGKRGVIDVLRKGVEHGPVHFDLFYGTPSPAIGRVLRACQTRSMILTSQLPVARWHEQIGDPTVADGILDRLVHNARRIEMKGDSTRKKRGEGA